MRLFVLLALALILVPVAVGQDWTAVPPPAPQSYVVEITGMGEDVLFLTAESHWESLHRTYRSDDGGSSWKELAVRPHRESGGDDRTYVNVLPNGRVAISGRIGNLAGVYLSSDLGETWSRLSEGVATLIEPTGPNAVVLGSRAWSKESRCQTDHPGWTCELTDLKIAFLDRLRSSALTTRRTWHQMAVSEDGQSIFGSIRYGSAPVERSRNRGGTWDTLSVSGATDLLTLGGDTLIVATYDGISFSADGGDSVETAMELSSRRSFEAKLTTSPHGWLYAWMGDDRRPGTSEDIAPSVFVSTNRGVSWEPLDTESAKGRAFLAPSAPTGIWARTPTDAWFPTASTDIACVAKTGGGRSNAFAWPAQGGHLAFVYRGAPGTWAPVSNVPAGWEGYAALGTLSGIIGEKAATRDGLFTGAGAPCDELWNGGHDRARPLLVAGDWPDSEVVVYEEDGVRRLSPDPTFVGARSDLGWWRDLAFDAGRYHAVSKRSVWTSDDGATWTRRASLPIATTPGDPVGIASAVGGAVIVYHEGMTTRVNGDAWTVVAGDESIASFEGVEHARGELLGWGRGGVVVSGNNDVRWLPLGTGLDDETVYSLLPLGDGRYLAGTGSGVWELAERSGSWTQLQTGIDTDAYGPVRALQFSPYQPCHYEDYCGVAYRVIAYTEQQAYIGYDLGSDFTDADNPLASTLSLGNAIPTPSASRVRFDMSTPTPATMEAYDLLGRRVWQMDVQPGTQSAEWDGNATSGGRVSAGVYLIVLRTESETRTTRAVLL